MKIGIMDSGIGGLTVLHQAMISLPEEEYLYYADTDHVPYGSKSREEIIQYVDEAVHFLVEKGVKAIVIACNTATSTAIDVMRKRYHLPILGMEPAVKPAVEKYENKRVMVIATPVTIREEKLHNLIQLVDGDHRVDLLPLSKLASYAEAGEFDTNEVEEYIRKEFAQYYLENYSALILGCTHYNYYKNIFRKIFPAEVEFIDGSLGTINNLKNILKSMGQLEHNKISVEYYTSGRLISDKESLMHYEELHKRLEKMLYY
ncbi:MAG: glutamate racemase [Mobilitalea sp.]